jgi:serine/threonine protein kinase
MESSTQSSVKPKRYSVFNKKYYITESLGEGKSSKVYKAFEIDNPKKMVALKLIKQDFIKSGKEKSIEMIEQEINILKNLDHNNINRIYDYGVSGVIVKPSGREIPNLVYITLEYVPGGLLFDLCEAAGPMGEDAGRLFMNQITNVVSYMQEKKVVHRDIKLENVMLADDLTLKLVDFGFAAYKKDIKQLKSYRGTKTYMAPEIKEGKTYDGRTTDIFSFGVILFVIVHGIFPFSEARQDEAYYKYIYQENSRKYWRKTGGEDLSEEFQDLMMKMIAYDPK